MKIYNHLIIALLSILLLCGYKFPEKLPEPCDIDTYTFDKIKFSQTSVNEFAYIAPNYDKPEIQGVYTIYSEKELNNTYKSLRAGFKDNFLDWIELEFAVPQSMNKFKQIYGNPKSINTEYSKKFNYQDYGFFNMVTDKNNAVVFGITLYAESDYNASIGQIVSKLPDHKSFNFTNEFVPGQLTQTDFKNTYTNFNATKINNETSQETYTVPQKYFKHNKFYAGTDFIFSNGILTFINLKPKNLSIIDIKQTYGVPIKDVPLKDKFYSLEYKNFSVIYDKSTNKVISVGIVGAN